MYAENMQPRQTYGVTAVRGTALDQPALASVTKQDGLVVLRVAFVGTFELRPHDPITTVAPEGLRGWKVCPTHQQPMIVRSVADPKRTVIRCLACEQADHRQRQQARKADAPAPTTPTGPQDERMDALTVALHAASRRSAVELLRTVVEARKRQNYGSAARNARMVAEAEAAVDAALAQVVAA